MRRFTWESTPLVNVCWQTGEHFSDEEIKQMYDETMQMHLHLRPPVEALKQRLGKQHFTWVGEFRYWVWESDNWRVFASNQKGVCFEVRVALNKAKSLEAWQDFRGKVGLT